MSRRVSRIDVNMFPFLSVLCSIIGVLMLFILIIFGSRIIGAEPASAPTFTGAEGGDVDDGLSEEERQKLQMEIARLADQWERRQKDLAELLQSRVRLRELLALRREEVRLAEGDGLIYGVDLAPEKDVEMAPIKDTRVVKKPRFIEVDHAGYVFSSDGARFGIGELPASDDDLPTDHRPDSPIQKRLEQADANRDSEYLVFLVRPDGATAFRRMWIYLLRKYRHSQAPGLLSRIDVGWEPFSEQWLLISRRLDR